MMEPLSAFKASAPTLLVLSAPSGAGKSTLCQGVLDLNPGFRRAVTCTTRAARPGEKEGVDYYFLDRATFLAKVEQEEFIEFADVFGHLYGTLKCTVLGNLLAKRDLVLNIDIQGAASVRSLAETDQVIAQSLVTVFVTPPSRAELKSRLTGRGSDEMAVIETRLTKAKEEVLHWTGFDYLIVSGSKEQDLDRLQAIVTAEKMRTNRLHFRFDERL